MFRKAILIFIVVLLGFSAVAKPTLTVGSPAPSFSLKNVSNGQSVDLDWYLGKKPIVLSFFASWSVSCQKEILFLEQLNELYGDNIKTVGISYDRKASKLQQFITENKLEFTIVHDQKLQTLKDFRVLIIPTLFVIDQSGNISSIYVDFDKNVEEAVSKEIQKLL
ncbi:MAG: TlpA disulfide reductase family protein [Candidatus Margulisiibacteriota bacterium]